MVREGTDGQPAIEPRQSRWYGVAAVVLGLVASGLVWRVAASRSAVPIVLAILGPTILLIGISKVVHGSAVTLGRMTPLLRGYAVVGTLLGLAQLHALGTLRNFDPFQTLLIALVIGLIWFGRPRRKGDPLFTTDKLEE